MDLYDKLLAEEEQLAVVGLGYVGLPIAAAFSRRIKVVGFDVNDEKISQYKKGIDPTNEVGERLLINKNLTFTSNADELRSAKFFIVAVPTPVNSDKSPDLSPLIQASQIIGKNLSRGSVIVYESTVYPGATEEVCLPILEEASGLKPGYDFKIGYSPERINPGDKEHRLDTIIKVVSGMDDEACDLIGKVYELVALRGIYKAGNIRTAEAAKVIENAQRDINIAFMNELSIIFGKLGVDTEQVLKAAGTKWNFLKFAPGLVGGHCIGVDPYYLTYKAQQAGYHSQIILAGRKINDDMGKYIAENIVKYIARSGICLSMARVAILGFTFKENCPDIRNTKVIDIVAELADYNIKPLVCDPIADRKHVDAEYSLSLSDMEDIRDMDCIVFAVAHDEIKGIPIYKLNDYFSEGGPKIIFDIKRVFDSEQLQKMGYTYWGL